MKLRKVRNFQKLKETKNLLTEIAHCLPSSVYEEFIAKLQALIVTEKALLDDSYYDSIGCLLNQFTR